MGPLRSDGAVRGRCHSRPLLGKEQPDIQSEHARGRPSRERENARWRPPFPQRWGWPPSPMSLQRQETGAHYPDPSPDPGLPDPLLPTHSLREQGRAPPWHPPPTPAFPPLPSRPCLPAPVFPPPAFRAAIVGKAGLQTIPTGSFLLFPAQGRLHSEQGQALLRPVSGSGPHRRAPAFRLGRNTQGPARLSS